MAVQHAATGFDSQSKSLWYSVPPSQRAEIVVTNAEGKLVKSVRGVSGDGVLSMRNSVSASGIFFVRVIADNQALQLKEFLSE